MSRSAPLEPSSVLRGDPAHLYPGEGLNALKFAVGTFNNNVYLVWDPASGNGVVIDPAASPRRILGEVANARITVTAVLLTHGHSDHVGALRAVIAELRVPLACHPADAAILPVHPDLLLQDGQQIPVGAGSLRVLHTPGHSPGGVSFLAAGRQVFSGDTLFPGGPGNTFGNADAFRQIVNSIERSLFTLDDHILVCPGHGADTTIGTQRPQLAEWIERGW